MRFASLGPNLATLANALVGIGAIAYTLAGNKLWAVLLITSGVGFDGLDGFLHRRLKLPPNRFGRIADSVADAITFGLAPGVVLAVHTDHQQLWASWSSSADLVGLLVASLAIARLVYFTLRGYQNPYFVGAPSPHGALAVVLIVLLFDVPAFLGTNPPAALGAAILAGVSMVLPVRFPKIRRDSALRLPMTGTAIALVFALLFLQFRPSDGSFPFELAFGATIVSAAGVLLYYLAGPFSVRREGMPPSGSAAP